VRVEARERLKRRSAAAGGRRGGRGSRLPGRAAVTALPTGSPGPAAAPPARAGAAGGCSRHVHLASRRVVAQLLVCGERREGCVAHHSLERLWRGQLVESSPPGSAPRLAAATSTYRGCRRPRRRSRPKRGAAARRSPSSARLYAPGRGSATHSASSPSGRRQRECARARGP
jgi:hypothetical protein